MLTRLLHRFRIWRVRHHMAALGYPIWDLTDGEVEHGLMQAARQLAAPADIPEWELVVDDPEYERTRHRIDPLDNGKGVWMLATEAMHVRDLHVVHRGRVIYSRFDCDIILTPCTTLSLMWA